MIVPIITIIACLVLSMRMIYENPVVVYVCLIILNYMIEYGCVMVSNFTLKGFVAIVKTKWNSFFIEFKNLFVI
jgi:hypothetical protein